MAGAFAKTKKATNILRPAIDVTFDKDAEFEVFSEVGVQEVRFFSFFRHPSSAGGRVIKSRYLEAKPLKFSPAKSLCGTVGSPWVSLATLFGFWETLIKFSESMILYDEKSFFWIFFLFSKIGVVPQNSSVVPQKDTSIAGLRTPGHPVLFSRDPGK